MQEFSPAAFGWIRDLPDFRDHVVSDLAACATRRSGTGRPRKRPDSVDLREFLPPVEDQRPLGASCAFACLALVEYFKRRAAGYATPASKLFLHHASLRLQGVSEAPGIGLRTTLKALVRFGTPPERFWPYEGDLFDRLPDDPFLFGFAREYAVLRYLRLADPNASGRETLEAVQGLLSAGIPAVFGFSVPTSVSLDAALPYVPDADGVLGGQAAVAVGYDDAVRIGVRKGALLVRLSWGRDWGEEGYGWLPYAYVLDRYAVDFWTVWHEGWLEAAELFFPVADNIEVA